MAGWKLYPRTNSVRETWHLAKSEAESLKEEIEEWESNMGDSEGLSATAKYGEVEECNESLQYVTDALDEIDEDIFESDEDVIYYEYRRKRYPRWRRLAESRMQLEALKDWAEEKDKAQEELETSEQKDYESVINSLEEAIDSMDNVMFPGMF